MVKSEIYLPEISEYNIGVNNVVKKDITIVYGNVPHVLHDVYYSNPVVTFTSQDVLIHIEDTARYYIKGNAEVIVEPYPGAKDDAVRLYILSMVLGALLHKNDILALHASSIKIGDGAVLIAGHSGAGKSTLALGLYRKGYEIINDDISSIYFDAEGNPFVYPGVKHLKLWAASLEKYGYTPANFGKLRDELDKYSFPIDGNTGMVPVKGVFFISEANDDILKSSHLNGLDKFQKLKANTYRYKMVQHLQKAAVHFASASLLANKVPFLYTERSKKTPPTEFSDYMEEQFSKL